MNVFHPRKTAIHLYFYGLIAMCGSDAIHAADLHDPSSPHASSILSPCQMREVLDLRKRLFEPNGEKSIKKYLDGGGNPNLIDSTEQNTSLLEMFSYSGHETFVDTLLMDPRICVSYLDTNGHNAFYQASIANNPSILSRLITHVRTHGADQELAVLINTPDIRGITALHISSQNGYMDIVSLLMDCIDYSDINSQDHQGRTALHLALYTGHDGIIKKLLSCGANRNLTTLEGLTAEDFFRRGKIKEGSCRGYIIEDLLHDANRRDKERQEEHNTGERERFCSDEVLNAFKETFERKCGSIFLAYRALESDVLQGAQDTFTVSNMINLLGSQVPLPGAGIVTTVLSSGAAYIEDRIETGKKETLTHFFTTIRDMEDAVEQAAYDLTYQYEAKISQLTIEGSRTLALCGVGRFIEFMRESSEINNQTALSTLVLESIQQVKPKTMMDRLPDLLPWTTLIIETKDRSKRWTERSIFEEFDRLLPNTLDSDTAELPVESETKNTIHVDSKMPEKENATQKTKGRTRGSCNPS